MNFAVSEALLHGGLVLGEKATMNILSRRYVLTKMGIPRTREDDSLSCTGKLSAFDLMPVTASAIVIPIPF